MRAMLFLFRVDARQVVVFLEQPRDSWRARRIPVSWNCPDNLRRLCRTDLHSLWGSPSDSSMTNLSNSVSACGSFFHSACDHYLGTALDRQVTSLVYLIHSLHAQIEMEMGQVTKKFFGPTRSIKTAFLNLLILHRLKRRTIWCVELQAKWLKR